LRSLGLSLAQNLFSSGAWWNRSSNFTLPLEVNMENQPPWVCVIDLFGVNYDGTLPSLVFACDQVWFGLFAVAPPSPPELDSAARPDGRHSFAV
jgi:hypothetical protein